MPLSFCYSAVLYNSQVFEVVKNAENDIFRLFLQIQCLFLAQV